MKKNNEELKHNKEFKMTKKNYIIIIVPIILILLLIGAIAYYVFIYNSNENRLKTYLESKNYTCNSETCSINVNEDTETIDYRTGILTVSNINYVYMINKNYTSYQDNTKELVCTYDSDKYLFYNSVDATFTTSTNCEVYIPVINKTISKYQEIFDKADIDVNQFKN